MRGFPGGSARLGNRPAQAGEVYRARRQEAQSAIPEAAAFAQAAAELARGGSLLHEAARGQVDLEQFAGQGASLVPRCAAGLAPGGARAAAAHGRGAPAVGSADQRGAQLEGIVGPGAGWAKRGQQTLHQDELKATGQHGRSHAQLPEDQGQVVGTPGVQAAHDQAPLHGALHGQPRRTRPRQGIDQNDVGILRQRGAQLGCRAGVGIGLDGLGGCSGADRGCGTGGAKDCRARGAGVEFVDNGLCRSAPAGSAMPGHDDKTGAVRRCAPQVGEVCASQAEVIERAHDQARGSARTLSTTCTQARAGSKRQRGSGAGQQLPARDGNREARWGADGAAMAVAMAHEAILRQTEQP